MIITRLGGGMGNQMFQYALGRHLSLKNNTELGLDVTYLLERVPRSPVSNFVFRNFDLDIFNIQAKVVGKKEIPILHRSYFSGRLMLYFDHFRRRYLGFGGKEKSFHFDSKFLDLSDGAYLQGDWQSPKYFTEIEEIIRQDFTLKSPLSILSRELSKAILSSSSLCINVRRKDFVTSSFHGTFGPDYYHKAINYLINKGAVIDRVYVFSDDIEWCRDNLRFSLTTIFVSHDYAGKKFEEYLYLMSCCLFFIIPNSSFAWWAAWLSNRPGKIVVAPERWFLDKKIPTQDLFPADWIKL